MISAQFAGGNDGVVTLDSKFVSLDSIGSIVEIKEQLIEGLAYQFPITFMNLSRTSFRLTSATAICNCVSATFEKKKISDGQEELKGGLVMIRTRTVRKHPFDLAVTNAVGFASERDSGIVYSSPRLLKELILKDGRTKMVLLVGENGAWEVTFQREPEWCPQEIVFYARRGKAVPKSGMTMDELKSWDKYTTSRCAWTHVPNIWVQTSCEVSKPSAQSFPDEGGPRVD